MQLFSALTLLASLVTSVLASAQLGCAEADRFGVYQVVPSTLKPGEVCLFHFFFLVWFTHVTHQSFTITATFNCTAYFGINPVSIDYLIEVPVDNNGYEPDILLARHAFPTAPSGQFPVDQFNVTVSTI